MNHISLVGVIATAPATFLIENGLIYTSFLLRVHGSYLDREGDPYSYYDEHTVICVGTLDHFIRATAPKGQIEVEGEIRSRLHLLRINGPIRVEISYRRHEVVADTIRFNDHTVSRANDNSDETLIALYRPEEA